MSNIDEVIKVLEKVKPKFAPYTLVYENNNIVGLTTFDQQGQPQNYKFKQALTGRGQVGFAGFFVLLDKNGAETTEQILLKEDEPGTCIMEGTAKFATQLLPKSQGQVANFAETGILVKNDGTASVISVQKRVIAKPWDAFVLGHKRNPKTLVSEEVQNAKKITKHISTMSEQVKWQLAEALFISAAVGDESVHTGQFMVKENNGQITELTRIDFGARARHSIYRTKNHDIDFARTSDVYKKSGQFGKDYISFYFADPNLKLKYTLLWAKPIDEKSIAIASKNQVMSQLNKLPEQEQRAALQDIIKIINKKAKVNDQITLDANQSLPKQIELVADTLAALDASRCKKMQELAYQSLESTIKICSKSCMPNVDENAINSWILPMVNKLLAGQKPEVTEIAGVKTLQELLQQNQLKTKEDFASFQSAIQLLQIINNATAIYNFNNADKPIQQAKIMENLQFIEPLLAYAEHLSNEKKSIFKLFPDPILNKKIEVVGKVITSLANGQSLTEALDANSKKILSQRRNARGTRVSQGEILVEKLRVLNASTVSQDKRSTAHITQTVEAVTVQDNQSSLPTSGVKGTPSSLKSTFVKRNSFLPGLERLKNQEANKKRNQTEMSPDSNDNPTNNHLKNTGR